ncbi:MAG: OmpA family protein [Rudanella sp.]|nr:OmpA family protein [Rudanella sp.]
MNYLFAGIIFGVSVTAALTAQAQVRVADPKETVNRNVEGRVNGRVDQGINRGLDKVEEGIGNIFKKKEKKPANDQKPAGGTANPSGRPNADQSGDTNADRTGSGTTAGRSGGAPANSPDEPAPLKSYSKFDFVAGEKIVAAEDFSQDAVGDFPAKWNTNGSAEVVTIEGKPGKWLRLRKVETASFIPDFVKNLPDNFTLEYDFVYAGRDKEYAHQQQFYTTFLETKKNNDRVWNPAAGRGATFLLAGGMGVGNAELLQTDENGDYTDLRGERDMAYTLNPDNNGKVFHIAMWRQKQRLRVYVDEVKVFDLPRIFPADVKLNAMRFHANISEDRDQSFVSYIRLAVGAADTHTVPQPLQ